MAGAAFEYPRFWGAQLQTLGWWHSFDLPDGTRIEGVCSVEGLRERIEVHSIPEDLRGARVLDIGAWDGWYSFEMERRGAKVVAIDCWDNPLFHQVSAALKSCVEYRQMDVYDLSPQALGRFDIVLFMGVFYHLKHPLLALERVCSVTTGMAVVDSFVLREEHRPGRMVETLPLMEFYEAEEFGGQSDNWCAPNLSGLMAMCRTAGFARVEHRATLPYSACVSCYRKWEPVADPTAPAPQLLKASHHKNFGAHFDSRHDEYVSVTFRDAPSDTTLDRLKPQVGEYGVRGIHMARTDNGAWNINFKLPPGLEPGWYDVTIRLDNGPPSNAQRIAVDLKPEQPAAGVPPPLAPEFALPEPLPPFHRDSGYSATAARDSGGITAFRAAYARMHRLRETVGQMPPSPATFRGAVGKLIVQLVQRCLFWYTPQIVRSQNEIANVLDSAGKLMAFQFDRAVALERDVRRLRAEQLERVTAAEMTREKLRSAQSEWTAVLEKDEQEIRASLAELKAQLGRMEALVAPLVRLHPGLTDDEAQQGRV